VGTTKSKIKLTTRSLDALPSKENRYNVFDSDTDHLGIAVHPSGRRTWFHLVKHDRKPKRTTLGQWPALDLETARAKALEINSSLATWALKDYDGPSPFNKKPSETFGDLFDGYLTRHLVDTKHPEKAVARAQWMADKYFPSWKGKKASSIRSKDVKDLYAEVGARIGRNGQRTRHMANRVLQLIRAVFFWAIEAEVWTGKNPASKALNKKSGLFREPKRKRFLNADELARLYRALKAESNPDFKDYVLLSLWCGARKSDVLSMEWEHVEPLENHAWNVPATTKEEPYLCALSDEAGSILKARRKQRTENARWVFPSWGTSGHVVDYKRAWKQIVTRARIAGVRQHDLRRTLASWQAMQGTSLQIIGKTLGHASSLASTEIYAQLSNEPVAEAVSSANAAMLAAMKKKPKALPAPSATGAA
jgi:integrase